MCNAKYQDTYGIVFWNSIDSGTFYSTVPWLARSVESREAAARCQRTMVDLLGKYMVLQAVNLVWVLLLMGDGMPAFDYYVLHTLCLQVRGCCAGTGAKGLWNRKESQLSSRGIFTYRCCQYSKMFSTLFNHQWVVFQVPSLCSYVLGFVTLAIKVIGIEYTAVLFNWCIWVLFTIDVFDRRF
jgi:hypothetical protein